jgi:hypothetical protein
VTDEPALNTLWPSWTANIGAMQRIGAHIRSQCCNCGTQLRVDVDDLVARYGPAASLIDVLDRCAVVGCSGSIFYLAARTYDRPWLTLLRSPMLRATLVPPVRGEAGHG